MVMEIEICQWSWKFGFANGRGNLDLPVVREIEICQWSWKLRFASGQGN